MKSLIGFKTKELEQIALSLGLEAYRGRQLAQWMYRKRITSFEAMTDLGKDVRQKLLEEFEPTVLQVHDTNRHPDGATKYLFKLHDHELIEAVRIPHREWETICLSTQVGCPIGCRFCASGKDFIRDLTAAEIISQVLQTIQKKTANLVFMGIGEPLLNHVELFRSLNILNNEVGIGARHLTVSTIGIVKGIEKLANLGMEINLGISLHAPEDSLRRELIKADLPRIKDILIAAEHYFRKTGRRISFEYVMLAGVNDQRKHAEKLATLLRSYDFKCHVNLIPYNETDSGYVRSSPEQIRAFKNRLIGHDLNATIRKERGTSIQAACGQLRHHHLGNTPAKHRLETENG